MSKNAIRSIPGFATGCAVVITLALFIGCDDSDPEPTPEDDSPVGNTHPLVGDWDWQVACSCGAVGCICVTPNSIGYTHLLRFYPDGSFLGFRNDSVVACGEFAITELLTLPAIQFTFELAWFFAVPLSQGDTLTLPHEVIAGTLNFSILGEVGSRLTYLRLQP